MRKYPIVSLVVYFWVEPNGPEDEKISNAKFSNFVSNLYIDEQGLDFKKSQWFSGQTITSSTKKGKSRMIKARISAFSYSAFF